MKLVTAVLAVACPVPCAAASTTIYQNNFDDGDASLGGWIIGEIGTGHVTVEDGRLHLAPGPTYQNRAFSALDARTLDARYHAVLSSNDAVVTWAFNITNSDEGIGYNNSVAFYISSASDPSNRFGYGYSLHAGGFVGNRMILYQYGNASAPVGPVSDTLIDVTQGLSPKPLVGAFRIAYHPAEGLWEFFFEQSAEPLDPLDIGTLVGSSNATAFAGHSLPYLIFTSQNLGDAYIDNFTVSIVPEAPIPVLFTISASLVALRRSRRVVLPMLTSSRNSSHPILEPPSGGHPVEIGQEILLDSDCLCAMGSPNQSTPPHSISPDP